MASTFQESREQVKVTILASEWGSSKGGLSTINRELAIQLAKCPKADITFFLPRCSEEDKHAALSHNIRILEATRRPAFQELEWLSFPPEHLQIDIIVGHGVKLGRQAQVIRDAKKCKWVQVVHTDPEELGMFKNYQDPISIGEEKHNVEVELCEMANYVVGVGPKLSEAFRKYLRWCKKDETVFDLTPGIFDEFVSVEQVPAERNCHSILVFGRGDAEDFELKGFDIAGKAVASLPDTHLVFVGAPNGKHEVIAERLTGCGVPAHRLRVRGYLKNRENLKRLFCEVDLVLMPSRTEGFGLTGLEALSAGLPVLVSKNSGFGEALSKVPFGSSFVVNSEDDQPKVWAAAIRNILDKDRKTRLKEATILRNSYTKKYSWDKQINDLLDKITNLVLDSATGNLKVVKEMPSFLADFKSSIANVANWGNAKAADKDGNKEEGPPVENKDWTLLHSAAEGGDVSIIETMLSHGSADVNSRDSWGATPLMIAAAKGKMKAVEFLLLKGADPSLTTKIGRNLLHAAVEGGNISIVKAILFSHNIPINSIDDNGITSLMMASSQNNLEVVKFLLEKGADPLLKHKQGRNTLFIASSFGNIAVVEQLLSCGVDIDSRDDEGKTPLMYAAESANIQVVNYLLEKDADLSLKDKNGWSLLHFAAKGGNVTIIETILSKGLDINIRDPLMITPLMVTVVRNNLEAMIYLLDKGADASVESSPLNLNPLHFAIANPDSTNTNCITILDAMLSHGVNINIQSSEGFTSLMYAAFYTKAAIVDYLLHKGADPSMTDNLGRTFLHHASEGGDIAIIEKCLSCGLDIESEDNGGKTPLMLAASSGSSDAVKFLLQRSKSGKSE